jgi:hypothetical protein
MSPPDNIYSTREYSSGPYLLKKVPLILGIVFFCLIALRFSDGKPQFAGWVGLVGCAVMLAVLLWPTLFKAAPLLTLSTAGVAYRSVSNVVILWREIQDLDMREHSFRYRMAKIRLPDSTVIWITKRFYESSIGNQSMLARGPFLYDKLILDGDKVGIVIPPEFVTASPRELFDAIDSRWRAFGPRTAADRPQTHILRRDAKSTASAGSQNWLAIKLAVPIVGIAIVLANIAGLWETKQQRSTREMRERWAEEQQRDDEERRKRDEQWKKFWADFDKSFEKMSK